MLGVIFCQPEKAKAVAGEETANRAARSLSLVIIAIAYSMVSAVSFSVQTVVSTRIVPDGTALLITATVSPSRLG